MKTLNRCIIRMDNDVWSQNMAANNYNDTRTAKKAEKYGDSILDTTKMDSKRIK